MNVTSLSVKDVSTLATYKKSVLSNFPLIILNKLLAEIPDKKLTSVSSEDKDNIEILANNSS